MKDKYNLNEQIVSVIKSAMPLGSNMIQELMDLLPIGREAIYRRLRGEVPFTFEEVAKVSLKMGFSLDAIIGVRNHERAVFDLNLLNVDNLNEDYCRRVSEYVEFFRKIAIQGNVRGRFAFSTLPYAFYLPFHNLSRFRLYRWFYQVNKSQSSIPFSEMQLTKDILEAERAFIEESRSIQRAVFILDREIFNGVITDINYFFKLNLISFEEIELLKKDLYSLVDELEALAISGAYKTGTRVALYLANVDLEASYSHIESDSIGFSHLRVLAINSLNSYNPKISEIQKQWIDSLKRCSTLITQSGEVDRFAFFRKQRVAISAIGED